MHSRNWKTYRFSVRCRNVRLYEDLARILAVVHYLALRQTQGTIRTEAPKWQPWIDYFLRALQQQKRRLERKVEREHLILGDLPALSVAIMELVRERGRVSVADIAKTTGVSRNTIKDHLKSLTKSEHLRRHGAGRGTWYAQS